MKVIKDVPWAGTIDDPSNVKKWQPELSFAVTPCCDYENADFDGSHHVMSVLAFHQPSKTLHIDDTFTYFNAPKKFPLNLLPIKTDDVLFNFNLKKILRNSKTPNAMLVYRDWYRNEVLNKWDIENAVFAHDGVLLGGGMARFERLMNFFE